MGWTHLEGAPRNDFVVVSQFRVDIPGTQGRKCIVPDEVLFVNGIPLALVECKKPGSALSEVVKQHLRYAGRRDAAITGSQGESGTLCAIRDSKDPGGPVLAFRPGPWRRFTAAVKVGWSGLA
jgi:hypothetical protein